MRWTRWHTQAVQFVASCIAAGFLAGVTVEAVRMWREAAMVSSRGGKYGFVYQSRHNVYRALRRKGMTKRLAAQISNAGRSFPQRSLMARKAARTRKLEGQGR